jgi:DNA-binding MarR family transcriptional regulator
MTENVHEDRFIRFSITMDTVLKKIQKYKNDRLTAYGLRSMHLMPMYCLFKTQDGLTAVELAKKCSVDKAFISRITGDLKELGYVDYTAENATAHYKKRLCLTDEGKNVMKSVNDLIGEAVENITHGIPQDQIRTFYNVLYAFDNNLIALTGDDN